MTTVHLLPLPYRAQLRCCDGFKALTRTLRLLAGHDLAEAQAAVIELRDAGFVTDYEYRHLMSQVLAVRYLLMGAPAARPGLAWQPKDPDRDGGNDAA